MSIVSFRKPSTSGYSGFHQRVCAPMLDRLRDAKIIAAYMGDNDERVMFRDAVRDCHFANLTKREMTALAAEFADLAEKMKEPNPFLLSNMALEVDGKNGLDRMAELLMTSETTRAQARVYMLEARKKEGGLDDNMIETLLSGGMKRDEDARRKLQEDLLKLSLRCTKDLDIQKLELEKDAIIRETWRKVSSWLLLVLAVTALAVMLFSEKMR